MRDLVQLSVFLELNKGRLIRLKLTVSFKSSLKAHRCVSSLHGKSATSLPLRGCLDRRLETLDLLYSLTVVTALNHEVPSCFDRTLGILPLCIAVVLLVAEIHGHLPRRLF